MDSWYRALVVSAAVLLSPTLAYPQQVDIKGLYLGMTQVEFEEKFGPLPLKNFTIAGVPGMYSSTDVMFHKDKLDAFVFFFNSRHFDEIQEAMREKYPKIRCQNSVVRNAIGGAFTQTKCSLKDSQGGLELSRFVSDIETSVLSLYSDRFIKESVDKRKARHKDL